MKKFCSYFFCSTFSYFFHIESFSQLYYNFPNILYVYTIIQTHIECSILKNIEKEKHLMLKQYIYIYIYIYICIFEVFL